MRLGVNVDHVATLRQARRATLPDPLVAALAAQTAGAHMITVHLREDRRHIQDNDVRRIRDTVSLPLNLEMAATSEMLRIAQQIQPYSVTLVPEKRQELTTEGGLALEHALVCEEIKRAVGVLGECGIRVSLFIDPQEAAVGLSQQLGASEVEIHTGAYANASGTVRSQEFLRVSRAVAAAVSHGLGVHAGHGLNYENAADVAAIPGVQSLQIGHAIVARAVVVGMEQAVREMLAHMGV